MSPAELRSPRRQPPLLCGRVWGFALYASCPVSCHLIANQQPPLAPSTNAHVPTPAPSRSTPIHLQAVELMQKGAMYRYNVPDAESSVVSVCEKEVSEWVRGWVRVVSFPLPPSRPIPPQTHTTHAQIPPPPPPPAASPSLL